MTRAAGRAGSPARSGAALCAAALGLHQLRFSLVGTAEARPGHMYLEWLMPLLVALLALLLARFVQRCCTRRASAPAPRPLGWASACGALLAIFIVQESLESLLNDGHLAGLETLFGDGGWIVFPLALGLGQLTAVLLRGAAQALGRPREPRLAAPPAGGTRILAAAPGVMAPHEPLAALRARPPPLCLR
ncbi:MAG: hypothetical protein NVSMB51_00750 [Solirubrobacteraceae bacterium]